MNPPDQSTPRTAEFARTLERELTEARADSLKAHQMTCAAALERDSLRAEVERLKANTRLTAVLARLERAEDEVERLTKQIKDDNRSYGCELRDPNGTIWQQAAKDHARAEKAEDEVERLTEQLRIESAASAHALHWAEKAEAERAALAKDKERLDWLAVSDKWFDYPATESFNPETFRDAIDAAMKGTL
jgi:trehalose-6-phosphatase